MSAKESQTERHLQNSNPDSIIEFEPSLPEGRAAGVERKSHTARFVEGSYPLGMVLSACPDVVDYAKGGISSWARGQAAIVVACILQRGAAIRFAAGYLRGLTRKAEVGEFSLGRS